MKLALADAGRLEPGSPASGLPMTSGDAQVSTAEEDGQLISDLFHALNQPITALRCALELSLLQSKTAKQYREAVEAGLRQAELVAGWATGLRDLVEARDAGDDPKIVELESFLREAMADLAPVAESRRVRWILRGQGSSSAGPLLVRFEPRRLRQALFGVLECAISASPAGAPLHVDLHGRGRDAVTCITGAGEVRADLARPMPAAEDRAVQLRRKLGLAIPRRLVEAAGGNLRNASNATGVCLEVSLPLARAKD